MRLDARTRSSPKVGRFRSSRACIRSTTRWTRCSTASSLLSQRGSLYAEEGKREAHVHHAVRPAGQARALRGAADSPARASISRADADAGRPGRALRAAHARVQGRRPHHVSGRRQRLAVHVRRPRRRARSACRVPWARSMAWPLKGVIKDADGQPEWKNIGALDFDRRAAPAGEAAGRSAGRQPSFWRCATS